MNALECGGAGSQIFPVGSAITRAGDAQAESTGRTQGDSIGGLLFGKVEGA